MYYLKSLEMTWICIEVYCIYIKQNLFNHMLRMVKFFSQQFSFDVVPYPHIDINSDEQWSHA